MDKNPETRCGRNGIIDIQQLGFYSGFDWNTLVKSKESPLIPFDDMGVEVSNSTESSLSSSGVFSFSNFSYEYV